MEVVKKSSMHVAMLLTSGMGHLIPFIELAQKLIQQHNSITITFILPHDDGFNMKPQKALLQSIPSINTIFLPPVNFDDLLKDINIEARISLGVIRSLPALHELLSRLHESSPLSAFVVDLLGTFSFDVVKDFGVPSYVFFSSSAMVLSLTLHLPNLIDPRSYDLPELVKLPGCVPVRSSDLPDSLQGRTNQEAYKWGMQMCKKYLSADGILVNNFLDLEHDIYKAFEEDGKLPPIYPVGTLVRSGSSKDNECLKWLDEQPDGSVLYVSFGSGGTLSSKQPKELALGLEMSEQRFLWVVKSPHDEARNAKYFTIDEKEEMDRFEFLSTDFMNRTKRMGFLFAQWAPQIEILAHRAVGVFVTHCGWNSVLEIIVHGVPIIAWPLFAEQRMNAVLLSDDLKVALRVRENEDGIVDSEQIAKLAKSLIQGKEEEKGIQIRNRIVSLKGASAQALTNDGYSTKSLAKVIGKWIGVE